MKKMMLLFVLLLCVISFLPLAGAPTYYYSSVTPHDFTPVGGDYYSWNIGTSYMYRSSSSQAAPMGATLDVPDGEYVEQVMCRYYDNDSSYGLEVNLYKKTLEGVVSCGTGTTSGNFAYGRTIYVDNSNCTYDEVNHNIDDGSDYYAAYFVTVRNLFGTTNSIRLYECTVQYY